nr:hypothetical protein [Tanacetum cinerariifolium]
LKDSVSWVKDTGSHRVLGEVNGTVQVDVGVRDGLVGEMVFWQEFWLLDVPMEDFKVYSNPLFDVEEINSDKLDPHCFNAESDFIESLSNQDTLIDSSLKFDYLEEISSELSCEIDVFANVEDDDYFPFIFVIRIFLLYLIYPEISSLLLSAGSEDTIFDTGIST